MQRKIQKNGLTLENSNASPKWNLDASYISSSGER